MALAPYAPSGIGHRLEALLTDRPTAALADSVRATITKLGGVLGLAFCRGVDALDRVVSLAAGGLLGVIGIPESPAHASLKSEFRSLGATFDLALALDR